MNDLFDRCRHIAELLELGKLSEAREALILLLDAMEVKHVEKDAIVNHLIRVSGLYPQIEEKTATLEDAFVKSLFSVDVGNKEPVTLHRDQSELLKALLAGKSLVVTAPTSFGKSFIIDALIALQKPKNAVIIVPTIALADEVRRRLTSKFANYYKIITTSDVALAERNLIICPQERALSYKDKIKDVSLFIVDEFYKISPRYDGSRYVPLMKLIMQLKSKAKQCYFLAPNIDEVRDNAFTSGMQIFSFELKTVYLKYHPIYELLKEKKLKKSEYLRDLLKMISGQKTLVYGKSPKSLDRLAIAMMPLLSRISQGSSLYYFSEWFSENYVSDSQFSRAVEHGIVQHHGRLHRPISQIVIRLFERECDCNLLLATSSLIEGVNTSAKNVVIWDNKKGTRRFDTFTYKNISGRAGRMFRHFVGNVYNMEKPPELYKQAFLDVEIPESELYSFVDENSQPYLSDEQLKAIKLKENSIVDKYGGAFYRKVFCENILSYVKNDSIDKIVKTVNILNSLQCYEKLLHGASSEWEIPLNIILRHLDGEFIKRENRRKLLAFIQVLSRSWEKSTREILKDANNIGIGIDDYFKFERVVSFDVASLVSDLNIIAQAYWGGGAGFDLTSFISRLSNAFLPPRVYDLEEYGLPRMISRKIHDANIINFESDMTLEEVLGELSKFGANGLKSKLPDLHYFDEYIIDYFYEGITKV